MPLPVDIIVDFFRYNSNDDLDTCRVLKGGNSRFDETPREIVIKLTDEGYVSLGTKAELKTEENLQKILSQLPVQPKGLTVKEILYKLKKDDNYKSTLYRRLNKLEKDGRILRIPGKGQVPDIWSRVADDFDSDATDLKVEGDSVASHPQPYIDATKDIHPQLDFDNMSEALDELSLLVKVLREMGDKHIVGLLPTFKKIYEYEDDDIPVYLDAVYGVLSDRQAENKNLYWKIADIIEEETKKRGIEISHLQKPSVDERSEDL